MFVQNYFKIPDFRVKFINRLKETNTLQVEEVKNCLPRDWGPIVASWKLSLSLLRTK